MKFGKRELFFLYAILLIIFIVTFHYNIFFLNSLLLLLSVFLLPGFFLMLIIDESNFLKFLLFSIVSSISIVIFAAILLNIGFRIPFDLNFIPILFLATTLPALLFILLNRKVKIALPSFQDDKWILVVMIAAIVSESILFVKIGTLMGSDVGRFASVSHIYYLEKYIVSNLQPYDLAYKYFYFPGTIVLPTLFETIGIDPIFALTFVGLLVNLCTVLAFYFFSKKLVGDYAIHATLFFAFLFNIPLYFILFAFQPFGMSYLFFFVAAEILLSIFFNISKKNIAVLPFAFAGIFFFHPYILFLFATFIASLFIYDFFESDYKIRNFRRMIVLSLLPLMISLIFILPYMYFFKDALTISFTRINTIDVSSYHPLYFFSFVPNEILQQILTVLFFIPVGFVAPVYLFIAFVIFVISWKKFIKNEKKILAIFFVLTFGLNYFASSNINFSRFLTSTTIFYPNVMPAILNSLPLNLVFVAGSTFFNSPSIFYYARTLHTKVEPGSSVKTIVWPEFYDAINFIRQNTSTNSTFLIDGGGAGCLGLSSSYGERIFPLTSRKVFYFTNYCWAEYNRTDYSERVDAFRKISENPSEASAVQTIKNFGVTHIYIGPEDIIFNPELFMNSTYYKLIFHENRVYIFQIN